MGLLLSLLPVLVVPVPGSANYNGAEQYEEWLRGQLKGHESETIDRAITIALDREAHNLQLFLEAFFEAYVVEEQGVLNEDVRIVEVLSELLQRHWTQLMGQGVFPYLSLKSLQVRTSFLRDRVSSSLFTMVRKPVSTLRSGDKPLSADSWFPPLVNTLLSSTVVPRGP